MVQTRAQERHEEGAKRKSGELSRKPEANGHDAKRVHRARDDKGPIKEEHGFDSTVHRILEEYGEPPLKGLDPEKLPASQVVMAHILNALLSSTRISHELARSALEVLLDAQYHDLKVLHGTSWYERTEVLTEGGYARYRERMASFLGDLTKLIEEKYGKSRLHIPAIRGIRGRLFGKPRQRRVKDPPQGQAGRRGPRGARRPPPGDQGSRPGGHRHRHGRPAVVLPQHLSVP